MEKEVRNKIVDNIFEKILNVDQESFAKDLYLNFEQIKYMIEKGMHFGSHGCNHFRFSYLNKKQQEFEIKESLKFLKLINENTEKWTMCYPYGDYNQVTLDLIKKYKCSLGLTINPNIADIQKDSRYELPRLDTNDIPRNKNAKPNKWYHNC